MIAVTNIQIPFEGILGPDLRPVSNNIFIVSQDNKLITPLIPTADTYCCVYTCHQTAKSGNGFGKAEKNVFVSLNFSCPGLNHDCKAGSDASPLLLDNPKLNSSVLQGISDPLFAR